MTIMAAIRLVAAARGRNRERSEPERRMDAARRNPGHRER